MRDARRVLARLRGRWHALALIVAVAALPHILTGSYAWLLTVFTLMGIYALLTMGLQILMGFAGQISLGHAAFYGMGAYGSAILTTRCGLSPWLALPAAACITALAAAVIGVPTLRLRGNYLAVATLGLGVVFAHVATAAVGLTGGPDGIVGIPALALPGGLLTGRTGRYYLIWGFAILALLLARRAVPSRVGLAWRAMRDSETAAASLGVDVARMKLVAFVIAAVLASVAGSLYASWRGFISPEPFDFLTSVKLVVMVVVGGSGSVWGALAGAALLVALPEIITLLGGRATATVGSEWELMAYGIIVVLVLVLMPGGLSSIRLGREQRT